MEYILRIIMDIIKLHIHSNRNTGTIGITLNDGWLWYDKKDEKNYDTEPKKRKLVK